MLPGPGPGADSRDGGHVVLKLGQEAREAERLVYADDGLQLLCGVGGEGNAPLPVDNSAGGGLLLRRTRRTPHGAQSRTPGDLFVQLLPSNRWENGGLGHIEPRLESFQQLLSPRL